MATVTVTNVEKDAVGHTTTSQVSGVKPADPASRNVVGWSIASVVIAIIVMCVLYRYVIKPHAIKTVSSYVPYAGVVAVSAALERFLEPLSQRIMQGNTSQGGSTSQGGDSQPQGGQSQASPPAAAAPKPLPANRTTMKQKAAASMAAAQKAAADPDMKSAAVQDAVDAAANDVAQVETLRTNRAVVFWAIASVCGIALSGGFGLFLLQSISTSMVNPYLDLAVTGLTIGAGTKPTHDLITSLQAKSGSSS